MKDNTNWGELKVYGDWKRKYFKLQPSAVDLLRNEKHIRIKYADEGFEADIYNNKSYYYIYTFFDKLGKHYNTFEIGDIIPFFFDAESHVLSIVPSNNNSSNQQQTNCLKELNSIIEYVELKKFHYRANLFKILGQSNTERWHTAFWSWLFNIKGSHGIGDLALKKLFETLKCIPDIKKPSSEPYIPLKDFQNQEIWPDGNGIPEKTFTSKNNGSKFDTYFTLEDSSQQKTITIIEYKVEAKPDNQQLQKYVSSTSNNIINNHIFIYVLPENTYSKIDASFFNEHKLWYILSYQDLYENILKPIQSNNKATGRAKMIIDDYIINLSSNRKNITMIYSDEEQLLVESLYSNHKKLVDNAIKENHKLYKKVIEQNEDYRLIDWMEGMLSFIQKKKLTICHDTILQI